ncbi:extracellular solute-binding protein [Ligilactobacillus sp.]|uniref:extracellular solute-binding protein n=1 Tax=Ligilactobacillus sp. TaxID=2767921 RepID=UPI002FE423B3
MNKRKIAYLLSAFVCAGVLSASLSGCSSSSSSGEETITFINHKTDWTSNGKWKEYISEFHRKYPKINVKVQTITDYAGQMKTRMNSKNYGDVFMLPDTVKAKNYSHYVISLGSKSELSKKYLGVNSKQYDGKVYGIPSMMNANGIVVNQKVFDKAGVTEFPTTPEGFVDALKKVKEKEPKVTPYYTNYASNWAMANWDFVRVGASGDPAFNNKLLTDKTPFAKGKVMYQLYNTLYQISKDGLIEKDPTTSDWEQSKQDLADGKIGCMVLGSWAIPQIQGKNKSNAKDIKFYAFPMTVDGKQHASIGADYSLAISRYSSHKKAARTFLNWLVNDSDYAKDNGGISTVKGAAYPAALQSLKKNNVVLYQAAEAPKGKESLLNEINDESEIGLDTTDKTKQQIVDIGIGNSKQSFDSLMNQLNKKWGAAVDKVGSGN